MASVKMTDLADAVHSVWTAGQTPAPHRPKESQYQRGQWTPPVTPNEGKSCQSDFHPFLRAFFPYQPSLDADSSTVTLPLQSGDVVLVHSIHDNGWADGTLMATGSRGWLPTNYCEVYGGDGIDDLLSALTVFWDLVKGSSDGDLAVFNSSDYARGLVGGVRVLLVRKLQNPLSR